MTEPGKSALKDLANANGGVVKVCGVTNAADAEIAIEYGADLIGLVLWEGSPRSVEVDAAAEIIASLEGRCPTVAVFGDVLAPEAEAVVRMAGFDWIQLCGEANPVYFHNFPVPILRRISASEEGAEEMKRWDQFADGFVLENAASIGGSGKTADWEVAKELAQQGPCLLAGGLAADNVAEGVALVKPLGVDASSRLESETRFKSEEAIEAYVTAAREAFSEESP